MHLIDAADSLLVILKALLSFYMYLDRLYLGFWLIPFEPFRKPDHHISVSIK